MVALVVGLALGTAYSTPVSARPNASEIHASLGSNAIGGGAAWLMAKKKPKGNPDAPPPPGITPAAAEPKRQAIRDSVNSAKIAGDNAAVADGLEKNAADLGDPVTMLEAARARLESAKAGKSKSEAEAAIETSRRALDMAHFYVAVAAGEAPGDWLVIEPSDASGLVDEADAVLADAEAYLEELEQSDTLPAPTPSGRDKRAKREKKPGTGLIAGGSMLLVVGAGGLGMVVAGVVIGARKQNEVEKFEDDAMNPEVQDLDDAGKQANLIAFIGAGVAVVGIAVGLPLIVVGAKKRKAAGNPPATARARDTLRVAPAISARGAGLGLGGRF